MLGLAVAVGVAGGMVRLPLPEGETDPWASGVGPVPQPVSTATTSMSSASARMGCIAITFRTPPTDVAFHATRPRTPGSASEQIRASAEGSGGALDLREPALVRGEGPDVDLRWLDDPVLPSSSTEYPARSADAD